MFKAKLITNQKYYDFRKKIILIGIPIAIISGLIGNFYLMTTTQILIFILISIPIIYYFFHLGKKMKDSVSESAIEISDRSIILKSKSGKKSEEINIQEIEEINVSKEFGFAGETFNDFVQELNGKPLKNAIEINSNGKVRRFDFVIESYYMIEQLKKIIESWRSSGMKIKSSI